MWNEARNYLTKKKFFLGFSLPIDSIGNLVFSLYLIAFVLGEYEYIRYKRASRIFINFKVYSKFK